VVAADARGPVIVTVPGAMAVPEASYQTTDRTWPVAKVATIPAEKV
jgi:hypothetical protein